MFIADRFKLQTFLRLIQDIIKRIMKIDDGTLEAEEENSPESPILLHSNRRAQPVDESNISESFPTLAYIDNLLPQSYQSNDYLQSSYNVNQPLIQKLSTFSEEEGVSSTQNWMSSLSKVLKLRSTEHFSEKSLSKSDLISILVYWGIRVRVKHLKADLYKKVSEIIDTIKKGDTTCYSHKIDERIRDSIFHCEKQPSCCNYQIQCCKCSKWRKVPTSIAVESLPDMWTCSLNTWDLSMAKCAYPQEQDDTIREGRSDNRGEGIAQQNLTEVEDYGPSEQKVHYYMHVYVAYGHGITTSAAKAPQYTFNAEEIAGAPPCLPSRSRSTHREG